MNQRAAAKVISRCVLSPLSHHVDTHKGFRSWLSTVDQSDAGKELACRTAWLVSTDEEKARDKSRLERIQMTTARIHHINHCCVNMRVSGWLLFESTPVDSAASQNEPPSTPCIGMSVERSLCH